MSKIVTRSNLFADLRQTHTSIQRLQRAAQTTSLKDVNTAGLSSAQIDAAVFSNGSTSSTNAQPANGIVISDSTNKLLLVRQGGAWFKTSLTAV